MLPAARAGAKPQAAIGIGKFHGTITPTTPSGSRKVTSSAAGDRDLPAEQPLRRGGVVVQHVADVARLPAGVADRVAGVGHLERGQVLEVGVDGLGEPAQQPGPVAGRHRPPRRGARGARPGDRRVGLLGRACRRPTSTTSSVAGLIDVVASLIGAADRSAAAATSASNRRVVAVLLGVPLHAEDEAAPVQLDGLDDAVVARAADDREPVAEPVEAWWW